MSFPIPKAIVETTHCYDRDHTLENHFLSFINLVVRFGVC